ncbi:MAG: 2-oxo acid dehydrogenase subunit E2 [Gammaproteobacteria bacterium]
MAVSGLRAFTMPKWGIEMVEGIVAEWYVEQGAAFAKGDLLVGIETDKIVNEVEAEYDAVCLVRLAEEGDTMAVGELLGVFGPADTTPDDIDAFVRDFVPAGGGLVDDAASTPATQIEPEPTPEPEPAPVIPDDGTISPKARAALQASGIDSADVQGSGRYGRIQLQDVQRAALLPLEKTSAVNNAVEFGACADSHATDIAKRVAHSAGVNLGDVTGSGRAGRIRVSDLGLASAADPVAESAAASSERIAFTNMRKQIARRLTASYQNIPHYYLQSDVLVDQLMQTRASFNATAPVKTSLNDWLVRAVALTLVEHPAVNVHVEDDAVITFADANVAVAVAIEGGLITPVLKSAQRRSVVEIQQQVGELATRARDGALANDDVSGGTFTVSNLGMYGVSRFTALINPPQGAILAVGAARSVPIQRDGELVFAQQLSLTLGCDHRAIDGATGGAFLKDLGARLENPTTLL